MKTSLIATGLLIAVSGFSQDPGKPFSLDGSLKNIPGAQKVYLNYAANGERRLDSAMVVDNKFQFKGVIGEPVQGSLMVRHKPGADGKVAPTMRRDVTGIYLSPGKMQLTAVDSFSNASIKGSPAQDAMEKLEAKLKPINDRDQALYLQYVELTKAKDEAGKKRIEEASQALDNERKAVYTAFLNENPASPIAVSLISRLAGIDIDADKIQPLFDKLPATTKALPSAKELQNRIEIARKTGIGRMAMDFTQNDTLGKPVSLSSMRGKVLLVDFWASWCGPCRRENPNVVKAFNDYKDKGFHVLGVSLDQPGAKDKWINAIHEDNLTWTHVSDLKYWDNDVAKDYGVRGIPFNLLLDKDGKIIGKNLRGEALEKKLAEVFN
ncbi:AhpC/TSA family protein [Segetibacter sp. 3557_3]|uniref:TlpA disulfide reductase family protein n=1 Tax=Segetibacter sp. 3557_3 TaxID=2547429 RepID=UPI00105885EC|nr:TlpA disulfide reductase family protein [Segetibacter sp. 3557_3]TDH29039.1 AhpC/TSA family protein [Segetibacter sp. 3557_3]